MHSDSNYRKLGYLGLLGFLGFVGFIGRPEMMSLFGLFGLFALFFTPAGQKDSYERTPKRWVIGVAGCAAMVVLVIVSAQYAFACRTVDAAVLVPEWDVNIYAAHVDELADSSETIAAIRIDRRTNTIVVSAEARHLDAAVDEVHGLVHDPTPILAASSLNVSVNEARDLMAIAKSRRTMP